MNLVTTCKNSRRHPARIVDVHQGVLGFEHDRVAQVYEPAIRAVPLSYGSWLFNEWTWRIAREMGAF